MQRWGGAEGAELDGEGAELGRALQKKLWCVPDTSYTSRTSCSCGVISWLVALIAFPFVFVGIATRQVGDDQSLLLLTTLASLAN